MAPPKGEHVTLEVAGREVAVSNPGKVYFPEAGITKLDVVRYYLAVGRGRAARRGRAAERARPLRRTASTASSSTRSARPTSRPDWIEVVALRFPSGRTAEEVVPRDAAALAWMANLGCLELHPHPVRAEDLDHPDELRVDLDPVPGVEWPQLQAVAAVVREVLADLGLVGWPKTSGSRGIHVNVRIHRRWSFDEVRRAALALAREVERRAPALATSKWWKEERHGVFLDYNQNAKDRTVASAYSVRPKPDARVSAPVTWDELCACAPEEFTLRTMPARFAAIGDRHAGIDEHPCSLELAAGAVGARRRRRAWATRPGRRTTRSRPASRPRRAVADRESERTPGGRRVPTKPLLEIARAQRKEDALAGLERWKARHPEAAAHLQPADVLVDSMRGRSSTWTRVRVNLEHVPEPLRPAQEPLDPDDPPSWGAAPAPIGRSLTVTRPAASRRSRPAPPAA